MKPRKFYSLQQAGREADVYIFGDIVKDRFYEDETSAHSLTEELKGLEADTINVFIDSYGGAVSEGWAIYNALRQHSAHVRTYGAGFVASAALYPFMAGDERIAMQPSAYFFHQVINGGFGNADDLRKLADEAEKLNEIGLTAFTENTSLSQEQLLEMMRAETWLSPQQALDLGIATDVLTTQTNMSASQSARGMIFQKIMPPPRIIGMDWAFSGSSFSPEQPDPPQSSAPELQSETSPNIMQMLRSIFYE